MDHESPGYSPYWETEEFEDLVTRGLIGLYETKVKKDKKGPKCNRFNEEYLMKLRRRGCYFPSHDRVVCLEFVDDTEEAKVSKTQNIDVLNEGLPPYAMWSSDACGSINKDDYLWTFYMERVPSLPSPFKMPRKGTIYRCMQVFYGQKVEGCGTFIVIDKDGVVESCYVPVQYPDRVTGRVIQLQHRPRMTDFDKDEPSRALDYYVSYATTAIQIFQDRRFLWNVTAKEGNAKATFTVYPEQIKSLFYSRDLPMTDTGRKRPILHWVQSHQRRMKAGTDVDIEKYLRGTNEFVFNNTKYEITNPVKKVKK